MRRKANYLLLKGQVTARFSFGRINFGVQTRPRDCTFWQCVVVVLESGPESGVGRAAAILGFDKHSEG